MWKLKFRSWQPVKRVCFNKVCQLLIATFESSHLIRMWHFLSQAAEDQEQEWCSVLV